MEKVSDQKFHVLGSEIVAGSVIVYVTDHNMTARSRKYEAVRSQRLIYKRKNKRVWNRPETTVTVLGLCY